MILASYCPNCPNCASKKETYIQRYKNKSFLFFSSIYKAKNNSAVRAVKQKKTIFS